MSASHAKRELISDPLDSTPSPAADPSSPPAQPQSEVRQVQRKGEPAKSYRALVGPVDMLGEHWVREMTAWKRKVIRTRSLSKLAMQVAMELAMSVDRSEGAYRRGYAIRSHQWLAKQLGGNRSNVHKAISALINLGFIEPDVDVPRGVTVPYRLTFPSVKWVDDDDLPPF